METSRHKPLIKVRTRWLVGGGILAGGIALSAVCITVFGGSHQEPVISDEAQVPVTIQGFTFRPDDLTVGVGTEIVWQNRDNAPHTATAEGDFDSADWSEVSLTPLGLTSLVLTSTSAHFTPI